MNQVSIPAESDPLGCEPGTVLAIDQLTYKCPFCGASTSPLQFVGTALDIYAVDADGFVVRLFRGLDGIRLPCPCWPGFWVGGIEPFPFSQIKDEYEQALQDETRSLPIQ